MKFIKHHLFTFFFIESLLSIAPISQAAIYSYTTIDNPAVIASGGYSQALDINNNGHVAGNFGTSRGWRGYVYNPNTRTYTTINHPDSTKNKVNMYPSTYANGLNDEGQIVGFFTNATGVMGYSDHGFVYDLITQTYTTLDNPISLSGSFGMYTRASDINNIGQIVGDFGSNGNNYGFVYNPITKIYTTLDFSKPNLGTYASGINDSGQVTGYFQNNTGYHGFVYDLIAQTYITLDNPNALSNSTYGNYGTYATGINDSGQVSGYFDNNTGHNNFVYNLITKTYTALDNPNTLFGASNGTQVTGINNIGQVSGSSGYGRHSFVATPAAIPLPTSALLFGSTLIGLIGFLRHKSV